MKTPDREFLELCGKARDNALTGEEMARLESLLISDSEARAFYRRFMHLQSALERSCQDVLPESRPVSWSGWPWAGVAAALIVLTASAWILFNTANVSTDQPADRPLAHLVAFKEGVQVYRKQAPLVPAVEEAFDLFEGDEVATSGDGRAVISYTDEQTLLVMSNNSRLRVSRTSATGKHVALLSGYIACQVDKQAPGRKMVLSTAQGDLSVLGTKFVLGAKDDGTVLDVTEGRVRFDLQDKHETVGAGESLEIEKNLTVKRSVERSPLQKAGIAKFVLVDTERNEPVAGFDPLLDGAVLNLTELPTRKLNICAEPETEVACVAFEIRGTAPNGNELEIRHAGIGKFRCRSEIISPYYLAGDIDSKDKPPQPWGWTPDPGDYVLSATVFADPRKKRRLASPVRIKFKVIDTKTTQ